MKKKQENLVWEVDDRYGKAQAIRILTPEGNPTEFAMVYGQNDQEVWEPVRPVSDRYTPISTGLIVDTIMDRIGQEITTEKVKQDRFGTYTRIDIALEEGAIKLGKGKAFDVGTEFTRHGDDAREVITPMVRIVNSYVAVAGVSVMVGWFRLVCSNGLMIDVGKGSSFAVHHIHTVHQMEHLVELLGTFECRYKETEQTFRSLTKKKLGTKQIEQLQKQLPKNYQEGFREHLALGSDSAWAALSHLTYLQSHQLSIARGKIVQPLIDQVVKSVA